MRLRSFRTQGFRCIKNSGTVALKDITALIGRNESGKTALLQSLLLLNKDSIIVDVDLTDGLEAEVDQSAFRVVEGTFELTAEESRTLNALGEGMPEIKNLTIYRESKSSQPNYDFGGITFPKLWATQEAGLPGFQKSVTTLRTSLSEIIGVVTGTMEATIFTSPAEKETASALPKELNRLNELLGKIAAEKNVTYPKVEQVLQFLATLSNNSEIESKLSAPVAAIKAAISALFKELDAKQEVESIIKTKMHPRFVYFSSYKTIHGAIKLSQYLAPAVQALSDRLDSGENLDKRETIDNLFFLAGLDPKRLDGLKTKIAALNKYLQQCSRRLTNEIQRTWVQDNSKVECEIQYGDDVVRIKISDFHPDGSRTNQQLLQRRSEGFRWYFSFHINFGAETKRAELREAILLLDEPGLHLHPAQQDGLLEVLRELAKSNQILYSTHSPFMIFKYDEGNLLLVETDPSTHLSRVNPAFWNGEADAIIPILHSLGAKTFRRTIDPDLAKILPPLLIVEGGTDYKYLKTINYLFRKQFEEGDASRNILDFELLPANGSPAIGPSALFNLHIGHRVVVLYDNEPDALVHADELRKQGFSNEHIVIVQVTGKQESDIEDIFSEGEYLIAVNDFYKTILKNAKYTIITKEELKRVRDAEPALRRIVPALEHIWQSHAKDGWGNFDKVKICEKICLDILHSKKIVETEAAKFNELFKTINAAITPAVGNTPVSTKPASSVASPSIASGVSLKK